MFFFILSGYYKERVQGKGKIMTSRKKPKKSTAKASKPTKIDELNQTHGKVDKPEEFQPTSLEQIWGSDGSSKYGTLDQSEYEKTLGGMAKSELHVHATKVGLIPVDDRGILTKRCIREFARHVGQFSTPIENKDDIEPSDTVKRILREGS